MNQGLLHSTGQCHLRHLKSFQNKGIGKMPFNCNTVGIQKPDYVSSVFEWPKMVWMPNGLEFEE
jgi:hypothetical protein